MENIKSIYQSLLKTSEIYSELQNSTGLTCLNECGKCCENPNIFARPSELLPMAEWLYQEGRAFELVEELENLANASELKNCIFYKKLDEFGRGRCGAYEFRPLICRSFGVFIREHKEGRREFSVCKLIKEEHRERYQEVMASIDSYKHVRAVDEITNEFFQSDANLFLENENQINLSLLVILKKVILVNELKKQKSHES